MDGSYEPNGDSRTAIYYCWKCIIIHILHITSLNFCKFEMHNHLSHSYYKLTRLISLKSLSFISSLFQLFTNYSKKNQFRGDSTKALCNLVFLKDRLNSKGNFPKEQRKNFPNFCLSRVFEWKFKALYSTNAFCIFKSSSSLMCMYNTITHIFSFSVSFSGFAHRHRVP